jgi:hypothetical protein
MVPILTGKLSDEDQIVAELALLGIHYLSQRIDVHVDVSRPVDRLLADLVRQPDSRVRTAVIALLLEHPEYSAFVPDAVMHLRGSNRILIKLFYTAAVILQQKYAPVLTEYQGKNFIWLPDVYSRELGVPAELLPSEQLRVLSNRHSELMDSKANWLGTYDNAARHLLRQKELERLWYQ